MAREKILLKFHRKDGSVLEHRWTIKKGIRGSRDAKKVRNLQKKFGDPFMIIGSGPVATLLRKEYIKYNQDQERYEGISSKDILTMGAEVTGVPVKKIQKFASKIMSKVKK